MNEQPTINNLTTNNPNTQKPSKLNAFLFCFLFAAYFIMIGTFIAGFFQGYAEGRGTDVNDYFIPMVILPSFLTFGLTPIFYCLIKHISIVDSLKLNKLSGKNFMYALLVGILLIPISSALSLVLQLIFPNPIEEAMNQSMTFGFIPAFIALAISPAIFEELTFRGLFFYKFRYYKPIHIALISSLTFGLVHFNMTQGVYATLIGFCLFYLVYYTNSIFSSMISHLVINGTNVTLLYLTTLIPMTEAEQAQAQATPSVTVITFYVVLACICSFLLYKLFKKIKSANQGNFIDLSATQIN